MAWCRGDIVFCEKLVGKVPVDEIADTIHKTVNEVLERYPHAAHVAERERKPESTPDNYGQPFSDADIINVLTRRMRGVDMHDIAREMGRTYRGIREMLIRHRLVKSRRSSARGQVETADVVHLTMKGMSQREVAAKLGTTQMTVGRRLKAAGVKPIGHRARKKRWRHPDADVNYRQFVVRENSTKEEQVHDGSLPQASPGL
jgi:hypothetical protein